MQVRWYMIWLVLFAAGISMCQFTRLLADAQYRDADVGHLDAECPGRWRRVQQASVLLRLSVVQQHPLQTAQRRQTVHVEPERLAECVKDLVEHQDVGREREMNLLMTHATRLFDWLPGR